MLRPRDGLLQRSSTRVRKNHQWLCPSWTDRDFNAHLGSLGGVRGTSNPNLQGILLSDIMDRHNLCAVCQCEWANGPLYTYVSGNSMTTVDYIFTSVNATSITSSCKTLTTTIHGWTGSKQLNQKKSMTTAACEVTTVWAKFSCLPWGVGRHRGCYLSSLWYTQRCCS